MKSCGVIITFMDWRKWKTWWFNIPLFLFQLTFMVVGTAIGKIRWGGKQWLPIRIVSIVVVITSSVGMVASLMVGWWIIFFVHLMLFIFFNVEYRNIDWRRIWRAAQASHVRLCLKKLSQVPEDLSTYQYINFGYPKAEIENYWRLDQCKGRFEYREPTFEPTPLFIERMVKYAYDQVGKRYDTLQLFSFGLNFIFWLWPPWWGQEKLKWLNLRGGREVCSSGITADLRWADKQAFPKTVYDLNEKDVMWIAWIFTCPKYDTAMVSPCLFAIDKNWKKVAQ